MGNLLPAFVALLPMGYGVWRLYVASETIGPGLLWIAAGVVLGWLAMNFLGLYQNGRMRRDMLRSYHAERGGDGLEKVFVGMARPTYNSIVDPHEDVGFLVFHGEGEGPSLRDPSYAGTGHESGSERSSRADSARLEYWGEKLKVVLRRSQIKSIGFRPNAHTLVGLGGWVSVEAIADGKPVRLMIEPRERSTLLGNVRFAKLLRRNLAAWLAAS